MVIETFIKAAKSGWQLIVFVWDFAKNLGDATCPLPGEPFTILDIPKGEQFMAVAYRSSRTPDPGFPCGNPTVEVEVLLEDGAFASRSCAFPSGIHR